MGLDEIRFNSDLQIFETGLTTKAGQFYEITLNDFGNGQFEEANKLAIKICEWLDANIEKVKYFAASKLIDIKNKEAVENGQFPISENQFSETIEFSIVNIYPQGDFSIYLDDSDLFWGYSINVDAECNLKMELAESVSS